jgi:5-oxoprolinase (ATP-hydrolysing)
MERRRRRGAPHPLHGADPAVIGSSRRNVAPFGLESGADGAPGRQWVERGDGSPEILSSTAEAKLSRGDVFAIETPGGGGYGQA